MLDTHALASCRSPYGRACRLTQVPWQLSVRRQTMISVPASTPCRWAEGSWLWWVGQGAASLTPHTLCLVPAWTGPAGAECSGRADHTSWPQGPAQRALLCVAGGLPAAPGPEVDGVGRTNGWASLGLHICGAIALDTNPTCAGHLLCQWRPKAAWALLSRLCLSLPPQLSPPWGRLGSGG